MLEHAAKMHSAVNRWVDGAILRPDAIDKPVWMSDRTFALVAHLKQFVFSFHETILKRVMHEAGNYSPALALASYVPVMIAADMAKGMIQGGGVQPEWKAAWARGIRVEWPRTCGRVRYRPVRHRRDQGHQPRRQRLRRADPPTIEQLTDAVAVMGGRDQFKNFALMSMPSNALYSAGFSGQTADPTQMAEE